MYQIEKRMLMMTERYYLLSLLIQLIRSPRKPNNPFFFRFYISIQLYLRRYDSTRTKCDKEKRAKSVLTPLRDKSYDSRFISRSKYETDSTVTK